MTAAANRSPQPDVTVIILNWNTLQDTRACLQSITGQQHRHTVELLVVDNASEDGSREMVADEFPQVRLLANPVNMGFGGGNNAGAREATGRHLFFLNSDTIVTPGAVDALVAFLDANPDVGIVAPKLLNKDDSLQYSCRHFPNLGTGFFRNTPLGRLFPRNRFNQDYLMTDWDHATTRDVDWVSGAAFLVPRAVWGRLGGFDEGFFMYCEDVDLCYRVHEMGLRVVYLPEAEVYHINGRSTVLVPTRMTWHFHRSMYRFYRKHYARSTPLPVRALILPGLAARATGQLVRYRWRHLLRALRGREGS